MPNNWTVTRDKFLTQDEVQKLYRTLKDAKDLALQRKAFFCHARDYYLIRLLLESGIRCFELTALKVCNYKGNSLIIEHGKGNKKRNVLLTNGTQKLLNEFLRLKVKLLKEPTEDESPLFLSERRKPFSTRGLRKRIKLWFAKCGFNLKLSVHSCRHTYASHVIAATKDLTLVRDNLGHSSLAVTSVYSHVIKEDLGDLELYQGRKG